MKFFDSAKTWLVGVALKKMVKRAIPWLVSLGGMFATKINDAAGGAGVSIAIDDAALAAAIASVITVIQNWVKTKFDISWL